jgi:hypothetical protein
VLRRRPGKIFGALIEEVRFAADSLLEGAGFEPRSLCFIGGRAVHDRAYSRAGWLTTELIRRSTVLLYTRERSGNIIMTAKTVSPENSNRIKNPDDWITGDEEMTGAQESYLQTLVEEAHQNVEPDLTKAEASKEIDRLRAKTGRGRRTTTKPVPRTSRRAF